LNRSNRYADEVGNGTWLVEHVSCADMNVDVAHDTFVDHDLQSRMIEIVAEEVPERGNSVHQCPYLDVGAEVDSLILQLTAQVIEVAHYLLSHKENLNLKHSNHYADEV